MENLLCIVIVYVQSKKVFIYILTGRIQIKVQFCRTSVGKTRLSGKPCYSNDCLYDIRGKLVKPGLRFLSYSQDGLENVFDYDCLKMIYNFLSPTKYIEIHRRLILYEFPCK